MISSSFLSTSISVILAFQGAFASPLLTPRSNATSSSSDGWPHSTASSQKSAFGITGGFKASDLQTVSSKPTLVGIYPKGSYAGSDSNPGIGGFIFEATGGTDLSHAKEVEFTYQVQFPKGFDFVLAGKLPGLYGGIDQKTGATCSGGRHNDSCFSARLMWREKGAGELYAYLPSANKKLPVCEGKCDVQFGASIGRGSWDFTPGQWTDIKQRVLLNDVGKMNGQIEVSVLGKSKVNVDGLQLRHESGGRIQGAMMHTFFGGSSTPDYKTPKDQKAYFRNFKITVTKKL